MIRVAAAAALAFAGCASRTPQPRAPRPPASDAASSVGRGAPTAPVGEVPPGAVLFPAGLSLLGATSTEDRFEQRPPRAARLSAFALDRAEVTASGYRACVAAGRCAPMRCDAELPPDGPARCLAWPDARAYCAFRGGRLPSEAEWQRAAAGPLEASRAHPFGDADAAIDDVTPEGVRDLGRSVAEWVDDPGDFFPTLPAIPALDATPDAAPVDAALAELPPRTDGGLFVYDDPRGASRGPWRVVRGGDDGLPWARCTSALRRFRLPGDAPPWVGVRCAYDP